MIIESFNGNRRGISVCKIHFEEAAEHPPGLI